ncbi:hypothetical protein ACFWSJ_11065 [Streptomyces niveus]|uniref:hypothetical protein n=1 Tax=Streptomyces niveus TaxID=193462 RepID=UPI003646C996
MSAMRILALGGPGAMGAVAVRVAAGLPGVTEIVVADRRLEAAEGTGSPSRRQRDGDAAGKGGRD